MKIMTVVGTRPELIRLSRVIAKLNEYTNHILVHTGQNYDYELNQIFFDELGIPKPNHFLNVNTSSLGSTVGDIFKNIEAVLHAEKPDAMLVLGDTNSCLSAYMAKRMHIPVYHMEAGNRCFDFNVPEEINRRIIDHIADFNLVYTEHARRHLLSEGVPHRRVYLSGSPMKEVLDSYMTKIQESSILTELGLEAQKYFLVSIHREENVDHPESLKTIVSILSQVEKLYNLPVIVSTHPRTRKRLEQIKDLDISGNIRFLKPFGFFDYNHLQLKSLCTISDSGTISEESSILGFPAITLRNSMERPEAIDSAAIVLTGYHQESVLHAIKVVINESPLSRSIPADYTITNTSDRVLKLIIGTYKLSNMWHGIKE